MTHFLQRPITLLLSFLLALAPLLPAQAAMIGNEQIIMQEQQHQTRDSLQQLLEQDAAREQLQAWGVSQDQIRNRIDSMTDAELAGINRQLDDLNAGGDSILGILLVIFIVFVITDVIGATDIFPFIHPVR